MRQALSVALIAGAFAQAPPPPPAFNFQPQPTMAGQVGQAPPAQAPAQAPPGSVIGGQMKGLPVIGAGGLTDSDILCWQGQFDMCGKPDIASIVNPNPMKQYQTQASDQAFSLLFNTGLLAADGRRVVTGNAFADQNTNVLPYWTTGNLVGPNVQGTVTVAAGDRTGTPLNVNIQAATRDPRAPNAYTPSASNMYLPQSSMYHFANMNPQMTTAPNKITSAGIGYSTGINTQLGQTNIPQPVPNFGGVFGLGAPQVWNGVAQTQWPQTQWNVAAAPAQWNVAAAPAQWNAAPVQWNTGAQWNMAPSTQWNVAPSSQWTGLNNWPTSIGAPSWNNQFVTSPTVSWTTPAGTNGVVTNPGSFATAWNAPNAQQVNFNANAAPNLPGTTLTTAGPWVSNWPRGVPAQAGQSP